MKAILSILLLFNFFQAVSAELHVGATEKYHSIREAIQVASAGDRIFVHPGMYKEGELIVNKAILLSAQGNVILDGELKYQILTIRSNDVRISGFKIQNSGSSDIRELSGIRLESVTGCVIENNYLYNDFFAIYLANSRFCKILNNRIEGFARTEASSGNGIHLWKSNHILISGNHISGHRDGIYFEFVKQSKIISNLSERNLRYGLHFMFSDHDAYQYNTFRYNGSGVAVMYTKDVLMEHNRFENNWGSAAYGLLLKEISYSIIRNNHFLKNTTGLYLEGCSSTIVAGNDLLKNGWALRILGDCFDDTISGNNFKGNTFDVATNASRSMNYFSDNFWDQYSGYDLDKNLVGDIPYHPVSLYSKIAEEAPYSLMLLHSFFIDLMDQTEKVLPTITPEEFRDDFPRMKALLHDSH